MIATLPRSYFATARRLRTGGAGVGTGSVTAPMASEISRLALASASTIEAVLIVSSMRLMKGTVSPAMALPCEFSTGKLILTTPLIS